MDQQKRQLPRLREFSQLLNVGAVFRDWRGRQRLLSLQQLPNVRALKPPAGVPALNAPPA